MSLLEIFFYKLSPYPCEMRDGCGNNVGVLQEEEKKQRKGQMSGGCVVLEMDGYAN